MHILKMHIRNGLEFNPKWFHMQLEFSPNFAGDRGVLRATLAGTALAIPPGNETMICLMW
jgi:hypothetical protein